MKEIDPEEIQWLKKQNFRHSDQREKIEKYGDDIHMKSAIYNYFTDNATKLSYAISFQETCLDAVWHVLLKHHGDVFESLSLINDDVITLGADYYDTSIEIYFHVSLPDFMPSKKCRDELRDIGFPCVYWNFLKDRVEHNGRNTYWNITGGSDRKTPR